MPCMQRIPVTEILCSAALMPSDPASASARDARPGLGIDWQWLSVTTIPREPRSCTMTKDEARVKEGRGGVGSGGLVWCGMVMPGS